MPYFVRVMDKRPADGGQVTEVEHFEGRDLADGLARARRERGSYASVWLASPQTAAVYDAIGRLAGRAANNSQVAAAAGLSRTMVRSIVADLRAQRVIRDVSAKGHGAPSWRQVAP